MRRRAGMKDRHVMLLLYAALACMSVVLARGLITLPLVKDEMGIAANTAFLAGDDWSAAVYEMGAYYFKPGLSILYLPLYLLFRSRPFVMYSAFNCMDFLIVSVTPVIAYYILRRYMGVESKLRSLLCAGAATLLPSIWLHASYTRADVILICTPWLIILLMLRLGREDKGGRRRLLSAILAATAVLGYSAHTRGLAYIIALVMTIGVQRLILRRRTVSCRVFFVTMILLMLADKAVSRYIMEGVHGRYGIGHNTVESFDFGFFKELLTLQGMAAFLRLALGWLFNLMLSTYGLFSIGMIACAALLVHRLIGRCCSEEETTVSLLALLFMLGATGMGLLFFFRYAYGIFDGSAVERVDRLLYGRYTVCAIGPVCLIGLYTLTCRKMRLPRAARFIAAAAYVLIAGAFFVFVCPYMLDGPGNPRYYISLASFLDVSEGTTGVFPSLNKALALAAVLSFAVMLVSFVLLAGKGRRVLAGLLLVLTVSMTSTAYQFVHFRMKDSMGTAAIKYISDYICGLEGIDEVGEAYNGLLCYSMPVQRRVLQYALPQFNVGGANTLKMLGQDDFLILTRHKKREACMAYMDKELGESVYYTFEKYRKVSKNSYVFLIRGEEIAQLLRNHGHALIPVSIIPVSIENE